MTSLNTVAAGLPMSFYVQASGVLAGCKLHTYVPGTTTPQATYSDYAGSSINANPIVLDTNGAAIIRYLANTGYKLVLNDPTDVTTLASIDNYYPAAPNQAIYAGTESGSSNSYTVTLPGTLLAGMRIWFVPTHTNTSSATLNGVAIQNMDSSSLIGGELISAKPVELLYDGIVWWLLTVPSYSGTFTVTLTGCTTSPTATAVWVRQGSLVTVTVPAISATSNTTGCTLTFSQPTGLPAPTRTQNVSILAVEDSGSNSQGAIGVTSGTLTLYKTTSTTFTNSGTKGLPAAVTFTYALN